MVFVQVVAFDFARKFEALNFGQFLKGHISGNMIDRLTKCFLVIHISSGM